MYSFAPDFDEDAILTKDDLNTDEQITHLLATEQLRTIEKIESKTKYYENAVDDGPKEPIDTRKDVNNPNLEEDKIMNIGTYSEACSEDGLVYTKVLRVSWMGRWLGAGSGRHGG